MEEDEEGGEPGRGGRDEKRVSQGDGEVAEIGQSCTALQSIIQLKKHKEAGANKKGS